jgi:AcrR family transcriptional regulator
MKSESPDGSSKGRRTRSKVPRASGPRVTPPFPDTPELQEQRARAPVAQAMIKATRGLIAREGSQWTTTERIHEVTIHPTRGRPVQLATMRYYFGNRERLFIQVARYEHLRQLDRLRRAFRELQSDGELAPLLARLAGDEDHYRVTLGLLEATQTMPELAEVQRELWADWRAKMRELLADLQDRGIVRADLDPETAAVLWSVITLGLAVHRQVEPQLALEPVLALAERYAASLPARG